MKSIVGSAWRLAVFAAVIVAALVLIMTAIQRPVTGDTAEYRALFTDANGLKSGDDVRMYGVQVGKVESIALHGAQAAVTITVRTSSAIYDNTRLAIRYQNLTGQRYLDLQPQPAAAARTRPGATIGTDRTIPSFDVTSLFNGLKPVLSTLSPEALNRFTASLLAVIEGDGSGIGPALDAIGKLGTYARDRQQVIGTLIRNLSEVSDKIGGRSKNLVVLLGKLADVFDALQIKINGLIDFADTAPPVLGPVDDLLATLGLTIGTNPDVDHIVHELFPDPKQLLDLLAQFPAVLSGLNSTLSQGVSGMNTTCSHGPAAVPGPFGVLIAGQKVTICKR
ncbi:MCE family protein [Nocardia spumae]|uniref:MCE family protein n=1 Tax=Nocardia spumae TaxID=2887190 RepID=UPI001D15478B|nr:MCE family protein [Nocardia spumae]